MAGVLEVAGLTKTYAHRSGAIVALDGLDLELGRGEIVGLLGPNGAGKSTTIKAICGLVSPTAGSITIDGVDAITDRRRAAAKIAAVLEGNRTVYWRLTVRENLEYFAALRGIRRRAILPRIDELIERFGLEEKAKTTAMLLSRGMQQKLALACAVLPGTPVLLLDEPTLGLDVEISHELRGYFRDLAERDGRSILLSSHDMDVVRAVCDRVVIINHGRVVTDDRIDNLLALFRARSVTLRLLEPLDEAAALRVAARFTVTASDESTVLDVALRDGSELYELMDALRAEGAIVERIESTEPDLEEVFRTIVREGRPR